MPKYQFLLNGKEFEVDVPGDMPLLWTLRDVIGLTGTKYGCGIGQCGACTVHVDGSPVRSCLVTAASVDGSEVTTIAGLAEEDRLHILQQVWGYDALPTTRTVDNHVAELRAAVEQDSGQPQHLLTVHGVGYRLVDVPAPPADMTET